MENIIKVATRPVILALMIASSWYFIAQGFEGVWVNSWITLTLAGVGEYIVIERPIQRLRNRA